MILLWEHKPSTCRSNTAGGGCATSLSMLGPEFRFVFPDRLWNSVDDVARQHAASSQSLARDLSGTSVDPRSRTCRLEPFHLLAQQRADHAAEHISGA